ncbi:MAG: hypothetical protein ABF468_09110 [Acetobacter fabarum]|uniref:hypothetical protein n=1 Tax=Acetobacter fabarum TaxID=483199 RepID=UPI0039E90CCD
MKILIDADLLCEQGVISAETAALLKSHARRDIGGNAINILVAFGSIAVAAGIVGLMASAGFSLMANIVLAALFGMIAISVGRLHPHPACSGLSTSPRSRRFSIKGTGKA